MEQSAHDLALRATVKDRDLEGVVRIATTEFFACSFLVGALPQVREKYPGIRVELVLSNTETDLLRREADIAMRFRPGGLSADARGLVAQKLGDEPFVLYGTDGYLRRRGVPSDPADLVDHDVVVVRPAATRHSKWCATAFRGATRRALRAEHAGDSAAMAAGLGLGVIPRRAARLTRNCARSRRSSLAERDGWSFTRICNTCHAFASSSTWWPPSSARIHFAHESALGDWLCMGVACVQRDTATAKRTDSDGDDDATAADRDVRCIHHRTRPRAGLASRRKCPNFTWKQTTAGFTFRSMQASSATSSTTLRCEFGSR